MKITTRVKIFDICRRLRIYESKRDLYLVLNKAKEEYGNLDIYDQKYFQPAMKELLELDQDREYNESEIAKQIKEKGYSEKEAKYMSQAYSTELYKKCVLRLHEAEIEPRLEMEFDDYLESFPERELFKEFD